MGASNLMERAATRKANHALQVKVVGSNPADPTTRGTGPAGAKIFRTLWELRKGGQSEGTLEAKGVCAFQVGGHTHTKPVDFVLKH